MNLLKVDKYIENGKLIMKHPTKFIQELDDVVKNHENGDIFKEESKHISDEENDIGFFIALTSSSLTGKTQAAFAIRSKLPLYFVFSRTQDIYRPFYDVSKHLLQLAQEDNESLLMQFETSRSANELAEYLSKDDFDEVKHMKLASLGLLKSLLEDAEEYASNPKKPQEWMRHLCREREIEYQPISIFDFISNVRYRQFISNNFVFLDEFSGDIGCIFLRNLLRFLSMTCVVSSTNSKVANLIGTSPGAGSRGELPRIWCVASNQLISISEIFLEHNTVFKK